MSEKKQTIDVRGTEIVFFTNENEDFISLTGIAKYKKKRLRISVANGLTWEILSLLPLLPLWLMQSFYSIQSV